MDWKNLLIEVLNSSAIQAIIISAGAWLIALVFRKKPNWVKYRGYIVHAIKVAEKAIPDNTPSKSLMRLDHAAKIVLSMIEDSEGGASMAKVKDQIKNAISIVHEDLAVRKALPLGLDSSRTLEPELPLETIPGMPADTP